MIKRPFICLTKPKINYELLGGKFNISEQIEMPKTATLLLERPYERKDTQVKVGDAVKTGQKIMLSENDSAYVISSVTGKISAIAPFFGDYGKSYTAITITTDLKEEIDDTFSGLKENVTLQTLTDYLGFCPGGPSFDVFSNPDKPIDTIVVFGGNTDLLIATNQYIIRSCQDDIKAGIEVLKTATHANIIIVVPRDLTPGFGHIGAEFRGVDIAYPSAMPKIIMDKVLNKPVPAGKDCEDMGVTFMDVEAVASMGKAFATGSIPFEKIVTLVKKDGTMKLVSARLGTPIADIFSANNVTLKEKDKLIIGGPLTGSSIYSEDYPISPETDSIMVQDASDVYMVSDYPCINCGECVRICPTKVPVNMLVRVLEAGLYQEAADEYDLYSCVDCGLCSLICPAKIPVFQYIKLGKYELNRLNAEKAAEVEAAESENTEDTEATEAANE